MTTLGTWKINSFNTFAHKSHFATQLRIDVVVTYEKVLKWPNYIRRHFVLWKVVLRIRTWSFFPTHLKCALKVLHAVSIMEWINKYDNTHKKALHRSTFLGTLKIPKNSITSYLRWHPHQTSCLRLWCKKYSKNVTILKDFYRKGIWQQQSKRYFFTNGNNFFPCQF